MISRGGPMSIHGGPMALVNMGQWGENRKVKKKLTKVKNQKCMHCIFHKLSLIQESPLPDALTVSGFASARCTNLFRTTSARCREDPYVIAHTHTHTQHWPPATIMFIVFCVHSMCICICCGGRC